MADMLSPVNGVVLDDGGITAGLYITPSNSPVKIVDTESYYFEFEVDQKEVEKFTKSLDCSIEINSKKISGKTKPVTSDGKKFVVMVDLENKDNLLLGMKGKATI